MKKFTAIRKPRPPKQTDILTAIRLGLESMERGESIPAREALDSIRRKYKSKRK